MRDSADVTVMLYDVDPDVVQVLYVFQGIGEPSAGGEQFALFQHQHFVVGACRHVDVVDGEENVHAICGEMPIWGMCLMMVPGRKEDCGIV